MPSIFKCVTHEGYVFKVLGDLLQNNIKNACFEVDKKGIKLRMMDQGRTILIDLELDSNKFNKYKYKAKTSKLWLGINLSHFYKMIKAIKKKDSIKFFIAEKSLTDLNIQIIPKDTNRKTTSTIKIQQIQNIEIDLPNGYNRPVIVQSTEFQKMCKGLSQISNQTLITAKGFTIRFTCSAGGVMSRYIDFGEPKDSDSDAEDEKKESPEYSEEFDTEQLTRITKLSGLSTTMQIFVQNDVPLKLSSDIGSLGKISIYLKSKNLQQAESRTVESEEENKE